MFDLPCGLLGTDDSGGRCERPAAKLAERDWLLWLGDHPETWQRGGKDLILCFEDPLSLIWIPLTSITEERLLRHAKSSAHGAHGGRYAALAGWRTCQRGHQQWKLLGEST